MNNVFITDEQRILLLATGRELLQNVDLDPEFVLKLFAPDAGTTWLLTGIDPRDDHDRPLACATRAWGCPNSVGSDLRNWRRWIERDLHFRPRNACALWTW
ncbi:DUF2958 domain-containing protein [Nitrosospira multiformis]|uniref:Uncharacterized protein n=1 Tax=Nitrosospira multiformis TaxID=1231 RepID=A0A1I7HQG6_9PROT|nr:DUF2958 domain-containing protein [Nitrosospira multiformis]SFU62978.1 Protein of unknown function [Nitrosospira multiformis]